jgi:hypothetical protein
MLGLCLSEISRHLVVIYLRAVQIKVDCYQQFPIGSGGA